MRKSRVLLFFLIFICRVSFSQGFYDINTINDIQIVFPQSNWDHLLDSLAAAGEGRLLGTVFINGQQFDSAGIRYKGNSSYNPNQVKNPLNIKLDYVIGDQTIEGYGTIKLSNGFKDPSLIRETMGYEIARKYMPASLSNYGKVTINGEYIGLYTSNQDVDKFFLNTWFSGSDVPRIKGEIAGNLPPGQFGVWRYYGNDSTSYFPVFVLESDDGWNELIRFLDTLNNFTPQVENVLNLDRHLWFLAFENLLVNLDSPINNPQNHYLDMDDAGRFNPVVWDLNETFGCFSNLNGSGPLSLIQLQQLDPFVHATDINYPVLNKILTNPLYKRMYVAHMKTMIAENFSDGWYIDRGLELQSIIDAEVLADPNKLYSYSNFLDNLYYTVGGGPPPGGMPIPGITELMEPRIIFLGNQAMFQATAPEITNISYSPSTVTPGTVVWFRAKVSGGTDVRLGYCESTEQRFWKVPMYDDGSHHDSLAGDGIYGASVTAGMTSIRYYIFADNGNACAFSPVRAEYEFYTVPVISLLVVNEFMASNVLTIADQDGEYDDWVEIFNNGSSAINLAGFNISDKPDNIGKWTFPDTTIWAGEYIVVWCDEDSSQAGLHANFKLSATLGEHILLSDPSLNVLDEVTFGPQKADTTTGRYPNGTGPFIFMWPTFGEENVNGFPAGIQDPEGISGASIGQNFPNPFSCSTTVPVNLGQTARIRLEVLDIYNRPITVLFDGTLTAGTHHFLWEPDHISPGVYICLLKTENRVLQKKMIRI